MKNRSKKWSKCLNTTHAGCEIRRDNDDGDNEINRTRNQIEHSEETNNEENRRRLDIKIKAT